MKRIALLALWAACGDNGDHVEIFTATSGTRLALQKYRFDDGTERFLETLVDAIAGTKTLVLEYARLTRIS